MLDGSRHMAGCTLVDARYGLMPSIYQYCISLHEQRRRQVATLRTARVIFLAIWIRTRHVHAFITRYVSVVSWGTPSFLPVCQVKSACQV